MKEQLKRWKGRRERSLKGREKVEMKGEVEGRERKITREGKRQRERKDKEKKRDGGEGEQSQREGKEKEKREKGRLQLEEKGWRKKEKKGNGWK